MIHFLAALLCVATLQQAEPPARDRPAATGTIRGHVIAADSGQPMPRASVSLIAQESPAGRGMVKPDEATTDDQGGFQISGLPPGDYRVLVAPGDYAAQYLPSWPGVPWGELPPLIRLAAGQVFDTASIALARGGVIAGRVTDAGGAPLARVSVHGFQVRPSVMPLDRMRDVQQTDDLGQFRLYGLRPGEYLVYVDSGSPTAGMSSGAAPEARDRFGFLTTFYPGAIDESAAQRVIVRAAGESSGVDIRMAYGRLARVAGTITDSRGDAVTGTMGYLVRAAQRPGSASSASSAAFTTDEQGRFHVSNVPPGAYRITLRRRPDVLEANPGLLESASVPIRISGPDVEVRVVTAPGAAITGQIVFDPEPESPPPLRSLRVSVRSGSVEQPCDLPSPPNPIITSDLGFALKELGCPYLVRAELTGSSYVLKSVTLQTGEDITNVPRQFTTGDRVTIMLSSRTSTIDGRVLDAGGKAVPGGAVMTFDQDRSAWIAGGTGLRQAAVDGDGHFRVAGLLAGTYYIVAASRERLGAPAGFGPDFFEELSRSATVVTLGDNEHRSVDLKMAAPGGQ